MKGLIFTTIVVFLLQGCGRESKVDEGGDVLISCDAYKEAVYASWIGQIIGNTYGLGYEFKFVDEPGPDEFPYGYDFTLDDLRKHDGAYSDDDTDIEYMYLIQMEKHGIEPSYYHLAEAWKAHVTERVWFANRMAVNLMHAGHYPPVTGTIGYNSEWFQIDPQLVNEIWAITAPGMVDYAIEKSEFAARITSDSFGLEPTLHYAAMYSASYFEKDIEGLIDIGLKALDEDSKFASTIKYVIQLYKQLPNNWQEARRLVKEKYYVVEAYNAHSWAAVDANLNGALGIMALLYGEGDFQKTLDYACAFGMDADNQAATMCGLLGIVNGIDSIPKDLMFPLEELDWSLPFNDSYKMITREGLDDASITDLAQRTFLQGEKIILAHGGKKIRRKGKWYYKVNTSAKYIAPFELNPIPDITVEKGELISYPIYTGIDSDMCNLRVDEELPSGLAVENGYLQGRVDLAGEYNFSLRANYHDKEKIVDIKLVVHEQNLASSADECIFNSQANELPSELLRDGDKKSTYFSKKEGAEQAVDYYGYKWYEEQKISGLSYNVGVRNEFGGWFTSFDVEVLKDGAWVSLDTFRMNPEMDLTNSQWMKPAFVDYEISFETIETKGIRIIGLSGGIEKDAANRHLGLQYFTTISELSVWPGSL